MPKRFVCRECKNINDKRSKCEGCGEEMETIEFPWTYETFIPYICAGIAAILLFLAYITGEFLIVWATFPLIAIGLIVDHLYQKKLDRKAEDKI